jgi:hypothetical protein
MMTSPENPLNTSKPNRFIRFLRKTKEILTPSQQAWRAAANVLLAGIALALVLSLGAMLWSGGPLQTIAGVAVGLLAISAAAALVALLVYALGKLPFTYHLGLAASVLMIVLMGLMGTVYLIGIAVTVVVLVIGFSLVGGGLHASRHGRRTHAIAGIVSGAILLIVTLAWLVYPGTPLERPTAGFAEGANALSTELPDPALPGSYPVNSLCYGSPHGRQIEPCQRPLDIETTPVDGSAFVEGWSSLRRSYWGFGPEEMPLNAIVWYPEAQGPFPLVVIVHGNAMMEKSSHAGYAYLGELLASRGFIVVSVDQNYLNLSFFSDLFIINGLEEENDARGWLLLEHLRLWHAWNDDPVSPFFGLVDLDQIALIGHSRGGEAITTAAAFNRMSHYPEDARIPFDYDYAIQAVAAIAPVDGQYKPGGRGIALEDVSYLVLQGAHDMDVVTYMATRQYGRVSFSGEDFKFKAGVFVDGANHGQFNMAWGRKDSTEPLARFFNLRQLMPGDEQRKIAQVYLSAFLEATLNDQRAFLPLFRDARAGSAWLPQGIYLSQYDDADTLMISDYEEDVDPSTTSLSGGSLQGGNLSIWREKTIPLRWGSTENRAVSLGWYTKPDTETEMKPASYTVTLPADLSSDRNSVLVFSLAGTNADPCQDEACRASRSDAYLPPERFDLTVEIHDLDGLSARLPLSSHALLRAPLETKLAKPPFTILLPQSEIVLQHFEFRLEDFLADNPAFNPNALSSLRLVFDRTPEGVVMLDDIGLRPE